MYNLNKTINKIIKLDNLHNNLKIEKFNNEGVSF